METLTRFFWIGLGGAIGAILRAQTGLAMAMIWPKHTWLGTLVANILGCAAFAFLKQWMDVHDVGTEVWRLFVFTGLLGAFTTFSTFESDAWGMWSSGNRALAIGYVAGSVSIGFGVFALVSQLLRPAVS